MATVELKTAEKSEIDPVIAQAASKAMDKSMESNGVMVLFPILYRLLAALAVFLFCVALLMSFADILKFSIVEIGQKIKTSQANYSYQVDDSNEYKLLDYSSQYLTTEPYLVYAQRNVLNMSMSVVGFAMIIFAFQVCVFLILKIRAAVNQESYVDKINFGDMKISFGVLAMIFVGGIILLAIYKAFFQKAYQTVASSIRQELSGIDAMIKNGLTKNMAFISALKNHNMPLVYQIFGQYAANAKTTNNYTELQNLFFTMSIFNYFDSLSPAASNARKQAMSLFGTDTKDVLPHTLFFYQGTNSVTSVFDTVVKNNKDGDRVEFRILSKSKMRELASQDETTIREVNDALLKLKQPTKIKLNFLVYLMMYFIVAMGIIVAIWWIVFRMRVGNN